MKKAEEEAYESARLHLGLVLISASRVLEVLDGKRSVIDAHGDMSNSKGPFRKPPFNEGSIDFIDDELKKLVGSAVAARVELGKASVFSKKLRRDDDAE